MIKEKIKNCFKKTILLGMIGTSLLSCEKYEYHRNLPETIISKETKILNETQLNKISKIDSTSISFSEATNYSKGNILVAGIGPQSPEGFLRKIESISEDKKTLTTSSASLEEAILKGEINFNKTLTSNDLNLNKEKILTNSNGSFSYPINVILYDLDNNESTTNDQLKLEGNINFNPEIKFKAKFDHGVREIFLESKLIENSNLKFSGDLEKEIDEKFKIAFIPFKPILIQTSVVPIVLTPKIELEVGSKGNISGNLEFDLNQSISLGGKVNYMYGKWNTNPICEKNFNGEVLQALTDAEVLAYLNQRMTLNINGVLGPFMEFQEYAKMQVNRNNNPWWNLNAGLKVNFGSDWGILSDYLPEINKTILNLEDTVLKATSPTEPLAKLLINPSSGMTPLKVYFDGTNSNSGALIKEYFFEFNDGTQYTETESSNDGIFDGKTSHIYENAGNYKPRLTIKDELNRTSTIETSLKVDEFFGWFENFENYTENVFPSNWIPDANAVNTGKIINENGNKILEMKGSIGGCWGALAYRERKINYPYEISLKIKNGSETLSGCHPLRSQLYLRDGNSWSSPAFCIFYFEKDGTMKDKNNQIITKVNLNEWHNYKIICRDNKIFYFVDGNYKKTISSEIPNYKNIDISVNEGTARFDDICIQPFSNK